MVVPSAASLGFFVDGIQGIVKPLPGKVGRVVSAFKWFSRRPRVSGRAIEKFLGHAVHFMLLRRELLSCMRSLYDFVQSSYRSRQRLWRSAAREAGWIADLLRVCHADLRKRWDDQVTSFDASLSGMAVSCSHADPKEAAQLARLREGWRFKGRDFVAPRKSALEAEEKPDPFSDPSTVMPVAFLPALNSTFDEVPASFMDSNEWHDLFAVRFSFPKHITVLGSRGVAAAVKHKCKLARNFNKKHLQLDDNLANVLCGEKGRSAFFICFLHVGSCARCWWLLTAVTTTGGCLVSSILGIMLQGSGNRSGKPVPQKGRKYKKRTVLPWILLARRLRV